MNAQRKPTKTVTIGGDLPIAERHAATSSQIALAWQLHRTANALPIPGTTSVEHLRENMAAADIRLEDNEVDAITGLVPEYM